MRLLNSFWLVNVGRVRLGAWYVLEMSKLGVDLQAIGWDVGFIIDGSLCQKNSIYFFFFRFSLRYSSTPDVLNGREGPSWGGARDLLSGKPRGWTRF